MIESGNDAAAQSLVACMRSVAAHGLSQGTSGNASRRSERGMWITPTGMPPAAIATADIVELDLGGAIVAGRRRPSSEWPMHAAIYRARPDARAIVHCHSRHATALACCARGIPAFHYMVATAGGDSVRCAPYALFGSEALAASAIDALEGRKACLLANHGQIALGATPEAALALALEIEELAAQYCAALAIGEPRLLDAAAMREVLQRFEGYGQPHAAATTHGE